MGHVHAPQPIRTELRTTGARNLGRLRITAPGCGLVAFLFALMIVFGVLAVTVDKLWWIGVDVLIVGIFAVLVENSSPRSE
ncbi:MAG: hypothetical protein JWN03_3098 [Nocardia sp.]|nr:hypothetical protein [Nocardia sp.]